MEAVHQPGDIIAQQYRITGTLGQGGVGITYAAEELRSQDFGTSESSDVNAKNKYDLP